MAEALLYPSVFRAIACVSLYLRLVMCAQEYRKSHLKILRQKKDGEEVLAEPEHTPVLRPHGLSSCSTSSTLANSDVAITSNSSKEGLKPGLRKRTVVYGAAEKVDATDTKAIPPSPAMAAVDSNDGDQVLQHPPQCICRWMETLLGVKMWDAVEARSGLTTKSFFMISLFLVALAARGSKILTLLLGIVAPRIITLIVFFPVYYLSVTLLSVRIGALVTSAFLLWFIHYMQW